MPSEMGNPNRVTASSSGGWASRRAGSALWMLLQAQNEFLMYSLKKPSGHLVLLVVFFLFLGLTQGEQGVGRSPSPDMLQRSDHAADAAMWSPARLVHQHPQCPGKRSPCTLLPYPALINM